MSSWFCFFFLTCPFSGVCITARRKKERKLDFSVWCSGFKKNTKPAVYQQKYKQNIFFSEDGIQNAWARRPLAFPAPPSCRAPGRPERSFQGARLRPPTLKASASPRPRVLPPGGQPGGARRRPGCGRPRRHPRGRWREEEESPPCPKPSPRFAFTWHPARGAPFPGVSGQQTPKPPPPDASARGRPGRLPRRGSRRSKPCSSAFGSPLLS